MKTSERVLYRNDMIIHLPDMGEQPKRPNWPANNITGQKWEEQLSDISRIATRANGAKRSDMLRMGYYSQTKFQTSLGSLSQWTSSQVYKNQMDMTQYSSSLIAWPKWAILYHAKKTWMHSNSQYSSCNILWDCMESRGISLPTKEAYSLRDYGNKLRRN